MKIAKSRKIKVLTYGQLVEQFKTLLRSKKIQDLRNKIQNK
jgi:hypothetical protein